MPVRFAWPLTQALWLAGRDLKNGEPDGRNQFLPLSLWRVSCKRFLYKNMAGNRINLLMYWQYLASMHATCHISHGTRRHVSQGSVPRDIAVQPIACRPGAVQFCPISDHPQFWSCICSASTVFAAIESFVPAPSLR